MELDIVAEFNNAAQIIHECLHKWNCPELVSKVNIDFNLRFRSRAGDGLWNNRTGTGRVRFSVPIWPHMTEADRRNTIIHEIAHVVVYYKHFEQKKKSPWIGKPKPHGIRWKMLMWEMGEDADRCHNVDTVKLGISKRRKRYEAKCSCMTHRFGPTVAKRIRTGAKHYRCNRCKNPIDISSLKEV